MALLTRRAQPARRLHRAAPAALVREWWRWALRGVLLELRRHESSKLELRWATLKVRREQRQRYRRLHAELRDGGGGAAARAAAAAALLDLEDELSVTDVLFFRSLARAAYDAAHRRTRLSALGLGSGGGGAERSGQELDRSSWRRSTFQLLSDLFEGSGERLRMRIPFACQTLSWSFLDRIQARKQAAAWLRLHADARSRGRTPPLPLPLDPVAELYLYGIDGDVVLWPDGARDVLISVQDLLLLDRYTPRSPCRRCIESARVAAVPPRPNASASASAASSASGSANPASADASAAAPSEVPFAQLRVTVSPKALPPTQEIAVWVSRLHMVVTVPLVTRLAAWIEEGWGDAHIYGYYLLMWIYRYEHIVTVAVGDLDGVLLNTEMGCAPLLFLRCSEFAVDSRYTCDQMHSVRLHSSVLVEYANARKGVWEPLMEPCQLQLLTQDSRATHDYALEVSLQTPLNINLTAALLETLLRTRELSLLRDGAPVRHGGAASSADEQGRFCLRNQTGEPLRFGPATPADGDGGGDGDGDGDGDCDGGRGERVVAHGESCHFDYWHFRADEQAGGLGHRPHAIGAPTACMH